MMTTMGPCSPPPSWSYTVTASSLYPPAPTGASAELARPTLRYRIQVLLTLCSLLLFVLLYIALVIGSACLFFLAIVYETDEVSKFDVLLKIGSIGCTGMLFLFLLKGLFKSQQVDRDLLIELKEQDQPELFQFIRQLARDTHAPFPRRVYLSHDVNAAVFYDKSLLSLVLPVRKNLLIGLGLVNTLTLSELKAVLAHEFGHFSQGSMKVGSYVYVANQIIADMVYGRDKWDEVLAHWRALDFRIGIFGWFLTGVVWALRGVLGGLFRLINFSHLALSRQMELNADLVAVSVTGSDALVHALARLEFASECLNQAAEDLTAAKDHRLYSRDLFFHQTRAADYLRRQRKEPRLGLPPDLPTNPAERSQVFRPGEGGPPSMWSTHPENYDREENAKRLYIRSPLDDRSPWALFRAPEGVRETVTRQFYQGAFALDQSVAFSPPEQVQTFIDEEHAETTYDPRYHGLYDGRFIDPGDVAALAKESAGPDWGAERARSALDGLYGHTLEERAQCYARHMGEHELLAGLHSGALALKGKDFELRDRKYQAGDVPRLLKTVEADLEADRGELAQLDRQVFLAHHALARQLGGGLAEELLARYRFHLGAQDILRKLLEAQQQVDTVLQYLSANQQVEEGAWSEVVGMLDGARSDLEKCLARADKLALPALKNIEAGAPLGPFLLEERLVRGLSSADRSIDGEWIGQLLRQLGGALQRIRRIHFKSLGGILALQESIARQSAAKVEERGPEAV
jgi:Zn-dependent protease with chaperone function